MYRMEMLRNILCLASLLAGVATDRQLQVHWNLQNYSCIVNFNEITLRMKVKPEELW